MTTTARQDLIRLAAVAAVPLAVHLAATFAGGYGYFRDELYYLACADHPAAGYVDQPPLSILILAIVRYLLGDSLNAIRLLPAVFGSATVMVGGLIARDLGGGSRTQVLAAIAVAASPVARAMSGFYSMNALDSLFWALTAWLVVRLLSTDEPRTWLAIGLVLGLGALNKVGISWWGAGLAAGVLLTPARRWLRTPWPYTAAGIALLLFLPYLLWNVGHDFAHLEFMRNALTQKYGGITRTQFLTDLLVINNPVSLPLWLLGLLALLRARHARWHRTVGIMFLTTLSILLGVGHAKAEYLAPAFPLLFAAGAVAADRHFTATRRRWLLPAYGAAVVAVGLTILPLVVPVLPVETFVRYSRTFTPPALNNEGQRMGDLPQHYADRYGWPEKVAAVAAAYNRLSPEEQSRCAIYADNYGRAAAIDFFGRSHGLPRAISNHNNYWIWGPRGATGDVVIILGGRLEDHRQAFERVQAEGVVTCEHCMPYENDLTVYVCRQPRQSVAGVWPALKKFI